MDRKVVEEILARLKKLEKLPEGQEGISKSLRDIGADVKGLKEEVLRLEEENRQMRDMMTKLEDKVDYLENQSRRKNLVIRNLPKIVKDEKWSDVENLVCKFAKDNLGVNVIFDDVERAHRVYRSKAEVKPIVVKFKSFKKKDEILRNSYKLKGKDILVQEDFSARVIEERRKLMPFLKEAREKEQRASLTYNRLKIEDRVYVYNRNTLEVIQLQGRGRENYTQEFQTPNKNQYKLRERKRRDDISEAE